jgi:small nuclear ribonucleoprotein (snRNP)-like protein
MSCESDRFREFVGQEVVVDTDTPNLYLGKLQSVDQTAIELTEVDVHDSETTTTPRDLYIINTAKYGIKRNRERVLVRMARVVSISRLSEVTKY